MCPVTRSTASLTAEEWLPCRIKLPKSGFSDWMSTNSPRKNALEPDKIPAIGLSISDKTESTCGHFRKASSPSCPACGSSSGRSGSGGGSGVETGCRLEEGEVRGPGASGGVDNESILAGLEAAFSALAGSSGGFSGAACGATATRRCALPAQAPQCDGATLRCLSRG